MALKFIHRETLIFKYFLIGLCLFLMLSCTRFTSKNSVNEPEAAHALMLPTWPDGALPAAILRTGEHPLWFQLTENGPVHLESIEDAIYSAALIPWPFATYISFLQEKDGEIVMVVNRDGFMKLAPDSVDAQWLALYRFSGGGLWQQYTVGGFVFYDDKPAALLYLDDRFMDSAIPLPLSRTWTFNMESNIPFPLEIPALEFFPAEDGWNANTLRLGSDGFIYYRVAGTTTTQPVVRMFRTTNLAHAGEEISAEVFFNSAPRRTEISHPSLPPLPQNFFYTGIGRAGDSLFASWEEQEDFNIGAAGFLVIR